MDKKTEQAKYKFGRVIFGANCIECGKKEGPATFNYAGYNVVEKGNHAFKSRIIAPKISGGQKSFLCETCVNKMQVKCKVHGIIKDSKFSRGNSPKCNRCEEQLQNINSGILPKGFRWILPIRKIVTKSGTILKNGFLGCSDDYDVHVISEECHFSENIEKIEPDVTIEQDYPLLKIQTPKEAQIVSCQIGLNEIDALEKGSGPWIDLWKTEIKKTLGIKDSIDLINIASIKIERVSEDKLSPQLVKEYPAALCFFAGGKIISYPKTNLPSMDNLKFWNISGEAGGKNLSMAFSVEGIPHIVTIRELFSSAGLNSLDDSINLLPEPLFNNNAEHYEYELSSKGIFDVMLFPGSLKQKVLFEIGFKSIFATPLPIGQKIIFNLGFPHNQTYLLFSKDHDNILTANFANNVTEAISEAILEPKKLFHTNSHQLGIFLDKDNPSLARTLSLYKDGFAIDSKENVEYSKIEKIKLIDLSEGFCELIIQHKNGDSFVTLNLVAPEAYGYSTWEALEVKKITAVSQPMETAALYKEYNHIKKHDLLIGLFADVLLLSRELDMDITMDELSRKLVKIDGNKLFEDKDLLNATTKKILLLNLFIPKIKQNFEYLSSFYPYYQLKEEIDLIVETFGKDIAQTVLPNERERVIKSSRQNVKSVQANIQRILSEIERAIYPVEQTFARDEIRKSLPAKIARFLPMGAQAGLALLLGGMLGAGGLVAGMLAIRALAEPLNSKIKDRETAAQIKRTAEIIFPWWKAFKDTMPVAIFEAGGSIDAENLCCMQRDKKILDQLPIKQKTQVIERLNQSLQRKIKEGTKNRFAEVLEGSGIRFTSLASDITIAIDIDMPQKMDSMFGTLLLPQSSDYWEDKDGQ